MTKQTNVGIIYKSTKEATRQRYENIKKVLTKALIVDNIVNVHHQKQ
ncbi:MAG: hypothetical protein GXY87_04685 [Tissierellia bacterium]|nr:hypothetical protein [Tissierellia bacterium]